MNIRRFTLGLAAALMLVMVAGGAVAMEIIDSWGFGVTGEQARNDARDTGRQACLQMGYSHSTFEVLDLYASGGGDVAYGLTTCFP